MKEKERGFHLFLSTNLIRKILICFYRMRLACFWSDGNNPTSFCGFHVRFQTAYIRRKVHQQGNYGTDSPKLVQLEWHLVQFVRITRPNTSTQTINRVICNFDRFCYIFESCYRNHWSKDFFLENTHFVVSFK